MVIEIVPKEKIKRISKEGLLFYAAVALFVIAVLAFLFLTYYEKKSLDTIKELDDAIARQKTKERTELAQRIFTTKKKIENLSLLIANHKKGSNAFAFLEKITHPKLSFEVFSLDLEKGAVSVEGDTEGFKTLGQQIAILKGEEFVKNINLMRIGMGKEGEIGFSFSLILDSGILKY